MDTAKLEFFRGTLDVLILKSLVWGPLHGYAITNLLRRQSDHALLLEEGTLYPALWRLENKGLLEASGDCLKIIARLSSTSSRPKAGANCVTKLEPGKRTRRRWPRCSLQRSLLCRRRLHDSDADLAPLRPVLRPGSGR
jgi:hypothetical protein